MDHPWFQIQERQSAALPSRAEQVQFARNAAAWKPIIRSKRDRPLEYLETEAKEKAVKFLFRSLRKKLNIVDLEAHALRRLMGTEIAQDPEFGILAAQQHLGHKSIRTTEIYIKTSLERRRQISEASLRRRKG